MSRYYNYKSKFILNEDYSDDYEEFLSFEEPIYKAMIKSGGDVDDFQGDIRHSSYMVDKLILKFDTYKDPDIGVQLFERKLTKNLEAVLKNTRFNQDINIHLDKKRTDYFPSDFPKEIKDSAFEVYIEAYSNE